ncbi:hypothetical protein F0259_18815 [Vibrio cyclitrophicus]|uniref:hypothetical protein n=1 Tax=Vibrio cyclitrophicus TaxID=47951 RepID=UPI00029AD52F|nr:hypothetical protein [Vibrio cyclitrophicus]NOH45845.1 hypothetical protein [Vibrio cyclitrophicus]OEE26639.1 hypothetical protein OAM_10425 [Vibrio cyclitrophicus ZF14]
MDKSTSTELEKLVNMAEEVSETVNSLHEKIANLRVMFMVSTIGLYAALGSSYFIFNRPDWLMNLPIAFYISLIILAAFLSFGSLVYIYKYVRNIRIYRRSLDAEVQILHRLLDMVHEYKENLHEKEMSYVEKAILDMKLQRIKYSSKW